MDDNSEGRASARLWRELGAGRGRFKRWPEGGKRAEHITTRLWAAAVNLAKSIGLY